MYKLFRFLSWRWKCEGGYREFLHIAFPLILSTGMWSIQHFIDRMFLTWYSPTAIAAAMPAGILNFSVMSLFIGTIGYIDTFVAQYYGAKNYNRIGAVVWQGIYISIAGGALIMSLAPFADVIFGFIGHDPEVQNNEIIYFKYLCFGAVPLLASTALAGFYAGRGETWPIMWINMFGTTINLVFDYFFIFGKWIFPEWGIKGAAIATVLSACFTFLAYMILIFRKKHNEVYSTLAAWRMDRELLKRIVRYGFPNGVQFFIDVAGFATFVLIMGFLGTFNLAANNIAFNINTIAFMPMIGSGIAVSVLVGQYLGQNRADLAERSVYSGFGLTFLYMASISVLYLTAPEIFIKPFALRSDPQAFKQLHDIIIVLLRFVAVYSIFDTMNIIFASGIKGAGDTKYVMYLIVVASLLVLIIPSYIAIVVLKKGVFAGWFIASSYVTILGFSFLVRFLGGKWKSMRVIETAIPTIPPAFPEAPSKEFEI